MKRFAEGTKVHVHSLGENTPGVYRGVVKGVYAETGGICIYIIQAIDPFDPNYVYSHYCMISSCVRAA